MQKKESESLQKLKSAFFEGNYQKVIANGKTLLQTNPNISKETKVCLGCAYFQLEKYKEAQRIFSELRKQYPESEIHYFLSVSLIKMGMVKQGLNVFRDAINTFEFNPKNIQHSIANMKIFCAEILIEKKEFSLAFKELKCLGEVFCKYRILDETFLHMRGIPSFITFLELLKKTQNKVSKIQFENLLKKLKNELSEDGNYFIKQIIQLK